MAEDIKPQEYWVKRAKRRDSIFERAAKKDFRDISNAYSNELKEMKNKLDAFYGKYGTVNGNTIVVTQNDAFQLMSRQERRSFQRKAEKIKDKIIDTKDDGFKIRLGKYINNKKQARKNNLDLDQEYSIHKVFQKQDINYTDFLEDVLKDGYTLAQFDLIRGLNYNYQFLGEIGKRRVDIILNEPWSGKDFSSRIWANKEKLANSLREVTTRGFLQGQPLGQMAGDLADRMGVSKRQAFRLLKSETTHASETANIRACKDAGFEKMEVVSTPSDRYHFTRPDINGQVFTIGTPRETRFTPPIEYPSCNCVTVPLIGSEKITIKSVPRKFDSFEEWKEFNNKTTSII